MLKQGKHILIALFLSCFAVQLTAQNNYASEGELKKQANKLFENDDFIKAYPLFSQLLALYPKDPNYNYKFGVCMLYSVSDKEKAIPYIEFGSKSPLVEKEVFYYLGRAYHLNYRFNEAINAYITYKQKAGDKAAAKLQVEQQITQCTNGKKLLKNLTDLVVMNKKELSRANFTSAYNLDEFGAKIIVKPDDFKTDYDKKKKDNSVMYQEPGKDVIYFSSYGGDGHNGKDIFVKRKLPNGEFGNPINVGYPINTEADEDYPFFNGKELYFCSKGHNSMGGYDVFKSEYNDETGTWKKPVNMDFPINTPDDDILFISDPDDKVGYFASTRSSSGDNIEVYKIIIDRKPVDIAIIKGKVKREDAANGLAAKITIKNMEGGQIIGIFNSKEATGDYLLNLPNGGKFLFTVEAPGYKAYSDMVEIPTQYELKPLGQEITLKHDGDKEIVKITNKFEENVSDEDYLYAMDFIKKRANLDVNYGQQDSLNQVLADLNDSVDNKKDTKTNDNKKNISNDDIITMAYNDAKEAQKDANEIRKDADNAQYLANEKNDESQTKQKELDQQQSVVNNATDPTQKQAEQEKYDAMKKESDLLNQQNILAGNMSKKLDDDAKKKQADADFALKYAKDLERAIKSTNTSEQVISQLNDTKNMLDDKMKKEKIGADDFSADVKKKATDKQNEADKSKQKIEDLKQEIVQTNSEIDRVKKEADAQKNPELKQSLNDQVEELTADVQDKQKQLDVTKRKADDLQIEAKNLKTQADYSEDLLAQINTGTHSNVVAVVDPKNTTDPKNTNPTKVDYTAKTTDINKKYEQQLKDADFISTELEREQKKTEIYSNWTKDAKKEQDDLKKKVVTTTDPVEKKKMQDEIVALNTIVTEKKKDEVTAKTNADKIKQQQVLLAANDTTKKKNTTVDTTHNSTAIVSNKTVVAKLNENVKQSESTVVGINKKYEDELANAQNASTPLEKEQKKAEIYKNWTQELNSQTTTLQQQLDTAKNLSLNDKIALQGSVNKIKDQQKEEAKQEKKTEQKVEELKMLASGVSVDSVKNATAYADSMKKVNEKNQTENLVVAKINDSIKHTETIVNSSEKKYADQLKSADKITDPIKKEEKKAEVYKNWSDELASQGSTLQHMLDTSKSISSNHRQEIQLMIEKFNDKQKSTETLAKDTEKKTQELKGNTVVAVNPIDSNKNVVANIDSNKTSSIVYADVVPKYKYTSTQATADLKKVKALVNESNKLNKQADSIKVVANATTDPTKRVELFDKASDLQKQAEQKHNESINIIATANTNEFNKNQTELDDLSKKNYTDDAKMLNATKLDDESKVKFAEAKKVREEASSMSGQDKENELKKANDLELEALNDQTQSRSLFKSLTVVGTTTVIASSKNQDSLNLIAANKKKANDSIASISKFKSDSINAIASAKKKNTTDSLLAVKKAKADASKALAAEKKQHTADSLQSIADAKKAKQDALIAQKKAKADSLKAIADAKQQHTNDSLLAVKNVQAEIVSSDDYKKYEQIKQESKNLNTDAVSDYKKADELKKQADKNAAESQKLIESTVSITDENKKTEVLKKAEDLDKQNLIILAQSDSIKKIAQNSDAASDSKRTEAELYLQSLDKTRSDIILASYKSNNPEIKTTVIASTDPKNTVVDKIEVKNVAVYSNKKPIPINIVLPEGLIFKVQVGAFRNAIPQNLFKGLSPLTGETTASGLTRYTAGVFKKLDNANAARDQIRGMGYKDAFVVAFLNGKRISNEEALAMINGGNVPIITHDNEVVTNVVKNDHVDTTKKKEVVHIVTPPIDVVVNDVKSVDVTSVTGLFYTVQVGVYSRKVTSAQLFGIKPLNSENVNNLIRYSSGTYNKVSTANTAKDKIVARGVKDAFVTAYYQGKRITLDEAAALIAQKGESILIGNEKLEDTGLVPIKNNDDPIETIVVVKPEKKDSSKVNEPEKKDSSITHIEPKKDIHPVDFVPPPSTDERFPDETQTMEPVKKYEVIPNTAVVDSGIVFKVQIGAFKEEVPVEIANKFIRIQKQGIKNYTDENGMTIYILGGFKTYEDAVKTKEAVKEQGLNDAFVISYKDGKRIPLEEAKQEAGQ